MRQIISSVLALALLLPVAARADDAPVKRPPMNVTPLLHGSVAPYDGLLLDSETFTAYANLELDNAGLRKRIEDRNAALKVAIYKQEPTFWQRNGFWFGVVLGGVVTGLTIWEVRTLTAKK